MWNIILKQKPLIKNHVHLYQWEPVNLFSLVPPLTDLVHWANLDTQLLKEHHFPTQAVTKILKRTDIKRITDTQTLLVCKQNGLMAQISLPVEPGVVSFIHINAIY